MTDIEGEKPTKTAADALCSAGKLLFGDRWKTALADALGVSPRTMKRWANGDAEIGFDHGAMRDLRNQVKLEINALQHRRIALIALEDAITDNVEKAKGEIKWTTPLPSKSL